MTYLTFTDRTTYIAARAQWRADYKALSAKIRETRQAFKNAQREFSKANCLVWNLGGSDPRRIQYFKTAGVVDDIRSTMLALRAEATEMISARCSMKEQAQEQYLANLNAVSL